VRIAFGAVGAVERVRWVHACHVRRFARVAVGERVAVCG
jgi:hypothetical protein